MQKIVIIAITLLLIQGCASVGLSPAEKYKELSADEIFVRGGEALEKENYVSASEYFEALEALYPFTDYSEQVQLEIIYAYYMANDYLSANSAAERFIRHYPRSENVDYAYYMKGVANFEQDRGIFQRFITTDISARDISYVRQSFADFKLLVSRFPNSQYIADSKQRMAYLRDLLANNELHAANYYMKRRAYVAAANRATTILQNYQGSIVVIDALVILVKANRALGLSEQAEQALQILQYNYPNAEELKTLI